MSDVVQFLGWDEADARGLLDACGVRIHAVDASGDATPDVVESVLPEGERQVRAEADIEVPDDVDSGMGAWHVNAVDEVHVVLSGRGIMQFITVDGPVAVVVEGGDVVEVRGAEHRYCPLTPQTWRLRFGGPADGDLGATSTGRAAEPWPAA